MKLAGSQPAHINTHTKIHTLLRSCKKAEADHIMQIAVARRDVQGIRTEMEDREGWRGAGGEEERKRESRGVEQKALCS